MMKNSNESATDSTNSDAFLGDLRALVAEAQKLLDASPDGENSSKSSALRAQFELAQAQFSDLYAGASKRVIAGGKRADRAIRDNPYQAIAIVAGVSLLLGVLIGRRAQ